MSVTHEQPACAASWVAIEHGPVVFIDTDGSGYCAECRPAYDTDYYRCGDHRVLGVRTGGAAWSVSSARGGET